MLSPFARKPAPTMRIRAALLTAMLAAPGALGQDAAEIHHIDFSFPYDSNEQGHWRTQNYRARHLVNTSEYLGVVTLDWGHDALGLDERGFWSRFAYLALAVQIDLRLQYTASLMIGHEMAHLQVEQSVGARDTGVFSFADGRKVTFGDAWANFFLTFFTPGPAGAADNTRNEAGFFRDHPRYDHFGEGLNLQTVFSEDRVRFLLWEERSVFHATAYYANRGMILFYSFADLTRLFPNGGGGDIQLTIERYRERQVSLLDPDVQLPIITAVSALSIALSPTTWVYTKGWIDYLRDGDRSVAPPLLTLFGVGWSYDLPTFFDGEGYYVYPTVYAVLGEDKARYVGARKLLLGFGSAVGIVGRQRFEATVTMRGQWAALDVDVQMSFGAQGFYARPEIRFALSRNFDIRFGAGLLSGTTLQAARENPYGEQLIWVGAGLRL